MAASKTIEAVKQQQQQHQHLNATYIEDSFLRHSFVGGYHLLVLYLEEEKNCFFTTSYYKLKKNVCRIRTISNRPRKSTDTSSLQAPKRLSSVNHTIKAYKMPNTENVQNNLKIP